LSRQLEDTRNFVWPELISDLLVNEFDRKCDSSNRTQIKEGKVLELKGRLALMWRLRNETKKNEFLQCLNDDTITVAIMKEILDEMKVSRREFSGKKKAELKTMLLLKIRQKYEDPNF
jgi:hypothetical protein